jgi:hypothetical protein
MLSVERDGTSRSVRRKLVLPSMNKLLLRKDFTNGVKK